jgi:two-component system response regulator RegX3
LFKYLGYEINLANTELEILEKIEAEKYDVILIDLLISGEDGYTMCENIRNRDKDIKVIALAESEADYDRKRARDVGINDFLIKPLHIEGVKKMLINWFSEAT